MTPRRVILTVVAALVALALPASALSKGLAEPYPDAPPLTARPAQSPSRIDIANFPAARAPISSGEELAEEIGSQVGRVAYAWAEGTSLPFLGSMVRGFVRVGKRTYGAKESLESRYGVTMRSYGSSGVSVMYRRRF